MTLKMRPRWKRIFRVPHLLRIYRDAGLGWRESIKIVWIALTFKGNWTSEV